MPKISKHDSALLALRLAAGVILVLHGYGKLFGHAPGMAGFTKMVAGMHFPVPVVFAYISAMTEFFGGLCLILGLLPRATALFIGINMLVAFLLAKGGSLPKGDPDLALIVIAFALGMMGHGSYSLSAFLRRHSALPQLARMEPEPVRAEE